MYIVCDTQINQLVYDRVYVYNSLPLYNGYLETVHGNYKTWLRYVNLWSKAFPVNISDPITVNQICEYMDARISPTSVRL